MGTGERTDREQRGGQCEPHVFPERKDSEF
jgi:hypothetical protein